MLQLWLGVTTEVEGESIGVVNPVEGDRPGVKDPFTRFRMPENLLRDCEVGVADADREKLVSPVRVSMP